MRRFDRVTLIVVPLAEVRMTCGRPIELVSLDVSLTYGGLLEGLRREQRREHNRGDAECGLRTSDWMSATLASAVHDPVNR